MDKNGKVVKEVKIFKKEIIKKLKYLKLDMKIKEGLKKIFKI